MTTRTKDNLTLKQRAWVQKTAQTLNATQAAREVYEIKGSDEVAKEIASENLAKPYLKAALLEELENQGVNFNWIVSKHKRNAGQDKNLPASNTALDMLNKIIGIYAPEERKNLNLNLNLSDPKAINDYIANLTDELRRLEA